MRSRSQFPINSTQPRVQRGALPVRVKDFKVPAFLAVVGISSSVVVHLTGDLFVAEILIVISLPFFVGFSRRKLLTPQLISLFALLGMWLMGQIISDIYNESLPKDRTRGMAAIIFFSLELAFFAMAMMGNERRKAVFLIAYGLGYVTLTQLQPNVQLLDLSSRANKWKWIYAFGITMIALVATSYLLRHRRRVLALVILLGIVGIDLLANARSAFLTLFVSIVLVFPIIPEQIGRLRLLPSNHGFARIAAVALLAVAGGWSANKLVHYVSKAGLVDERSLEKNESEAQAGNLLVGGRPEFFIGLRAAMDSPVLGHGSWARDMKYVEMQHDMMLEYGIEHDLADVEATAQGLIPSHSHLVGAWVSAGLFGAVFWLYLFWLVLRGIVAAAVLRPVLAPVYLWLFINYTWNILFSPFGSTSRVIEAFTIIAIVDLLYRNPIRAGKRTPWRRRGVAAASLQAPLQVR